MDALLPWIRLTKTGTSPLTQNRLLRCFGTPEAIFAASLPAITEALSGRRASAERILDPACEPTPRELELMRALQVSLITQADGSYPPLLREIHAPPVALYVRGRLAGESEGSGALAVAIVGSRRASDYGRRTAATLAAELAAAGITVVSGLALGVDAAAHQGALDAGGRTLACLACGVDVTYPAANRTLAQRIPAAGALVSEYPMMASPDRFHFPARNRIISGLCRGVVVVDAPLGSGALVTASCAVEQNREVFAVPGRVDDPRSRGAHALLRDGARLVESATDVLEELGLAAGAAPQPQLSLELPATPREELSGDEAQLLRALGPDPLQVDDLIQESGLGAAKVTAALVLLELKGLARRLPGNTYVRMG